MYLNEFQTILINFSSYMHPESKPTKQWAAQGAPLSPGCQPRQSRPNQEGIRPSAFSCSARERTLIPAPKAHTDTQRPCAQPRTQFGNPSTSIRSQGPSLAGGPPIHRGGELRGRGSLMPSRGVANLVKMQLDPTKMWLYPYINVR